jgi:hypothetical protein
MMKEPAKIGDVWFFASSYWGFGDSIQIEITEFHCVKPTAKGAWFENDQYGIVRKFVLTNGSRRICRTKQEALRSLIRRKQRQIEIVGRTVELARRTIELIKGQQ